MKKFLLISVLFVALFSMFSCSNDTRETTVTTTKTTISEEPNGFYVKKQVVVHGNTVWAFSKDYYGTGNRWRDIVSQNPFLSQPGRVYYDNALGKWIVIIYPGETIKIGNEYIVPTYVVEETVTKTTPTKTTDYTPWLWVLGGLLGLLALLAIINAIGACWRNRCCNNALRVDINVNSNIDDCTRAYILDREYDLKHREYDLQEKALDIIENGTRKNGRMTKFDYKKRGTDFSFSGKCSKRFPKKEKQPKEEDKK